MFVCSLKRSPAALASDRRLTVPTNRGKIQRDLTYNPKRNLSSQKKTEIFLYVNAEDNDPQQVLHVEGRAADVQDLNLS